MAAALIALTALAACNPAPTVPADPRGLSPGDALNTFRSGRGLPPLAASTALEAVALSHARELERNGTFSHTGQDGSTPLRRVRRAGYDACLTAENIAMGQPDTATVFADWVASDGHRRNMATREMRAFGYGQSGAVRVLVLARPC